MQNEITSVRYASDGFGICGRITKEEYVSGPSIWSDLGLSELGVRK